MIFKQLRLMRISIHSNHNILGTFSQGLIAEFCDKNIHSGVEVLREIQ